jgi:hypothetical protein
MSLYKSFLVASLVVAASVTSFAQGSVQNAISAYGSAEVEVAPDLATVTLVVTSKAPTRAAAAAANAVSSKDLLDGLASQFRMEKTDYRNSVSQSDDTEYDKDTQKYKIVGQIAKNTITVKTTHLDKVGEMIDYIISKGASFQYASYGLLNPQVAKEQALQKAAINAKANAQAALTPYGKKVGDLLQVIESGAEAPIRHYDLNSRAMAAPAPGGGAPSTDVTAGPITVSASMTVIFTITN